MIPYLLAIAGGYLIGNELKSTTFAKGGDIEMFPFEHKGIRYNVQETNGMINDRGQRLYKIDIEGYGIYNERAANLELAKRYAIAEINNIVEEFAKGGEVEISTTRRNIMGTLSFNMKIAGMRKEQEFIVYPIKMGDTSILIQSDTRIGRINMETGKGVMSKSHPNGAYGVHLSTDKLTSFDLTESQLSMLKEKIRGTAGENVGSSVVKSDNLGASQFAKGGEVSDEKLLKNTIVYDNGGESFDRYTVFTPDGSVYGMSENAEGFNMYIGDDTEVQMGSHLGKKLKSIPEGIKKAVLDRIKS